MDWLARAGKRAKKNPHMAGLRFGLVYRFLVNMRRIRARVAYIINTPLHNLLMK